jgi:hypothetical protein
VIAVNVTFDKVTVVALPIDTTAPCESVAVLNQEPVMDRVPDEVASISPVAADVDIDVVDSSAMVALAVSVSLIIGLSVNEYAGMHVSELTVRVPLPLTDTSEKPVV